MKRAHWQLAVVVLVAASSLTGGCRRQTASLTDNADGRHPEDFPELAADVF